MPRLCLVVLAVALAAGASADTIVLVDGRVLDADQAWYEGSVLRYRKNGSLYDLPRDAIAHVTPADGGTVLLDPDIQRSGESLARGDAEEALRHARLALFRRPGSTVALEALAAAQLALGDPERARESATSALEARPRSTGALELLGDALVALGDLEGARGRYRAALEIQEEWSVRRKLDALAPAQARVSTARFRMRYEGDANEALGFAVLAMLDRTWDAYESRLGFSPDLPVTVVLETASGFRDTTRAPEWAAAWNDGTIRVPVRGLEEATPVLVRVLRHELAHSFLTARVGPSCPTWLQEGLAQWLEGGDPARRDAGLAGVARSGHLQQIADLEAPFAGLSETEATAAYAQSLSAVAHLLRLGGPAGLRRLIEELASGRTAAEALRVATGLGYDGLQRDWEAHLKAAPGARSTATAGGR